MAAVAPVITDTVEPGLESELVCDHWLGSGKLLLARSQRLGLLSAEALRGMLLRIDRRRARLLCVLLTDPDYRQGLGEIIQGVIDNRQWAVGSIFEVMSCPRERSQVAPEAADARAVLEGRLRLVGRLLDAATDPGDGVRDLAVAIGLRVRLTRAGVLLLLDRVQARPGRPDSYRLGRQARRLVDADDKVYDTITEHNLLLVGRWLSSYPSISGMTGSDLFQEGVMGLVRAVRKYDVRLGYAFSTYASGWIKSLMSYALKLNRSSIRVSNRMEDQVGKVARHMREQCISDLREPGAMATLCRVSGLAPELIRQCAGIIGMERSIDASIGDSEDRSLHDILGGDADTCEAAAEQAQVSRNIADSLELLPPVEREIVCRRFGLMGYAAQGSSYEIGRALKMSGSRVIQLLNQAIERLRLSPFMEGMEDHAGWSAEGSG